MFSTGGGERGRGYVPGRLQRVEVMVRRLVEPRLVAGGGGACTALAFMVGVTFTVLDFNASYKSIVGFMVDALSF